MSAAAQEPCRQLDRQPQGALHCRATSATAAPVTPENDPTSDDATTADPNEGHLAEEATTANPNERSCNPNEPPCSKHPPSPRQKSRAHLIFNNASSLQMESQPELEHKPAEHQPCNPAVTGVIKPSRGWPLSDKAMVPLQATISTLSQVRAKITTARYREESSSKLTCQPGRVAQIALKPISNLADSIDSDKLGQWWSRQETWLNGAHSLFIFTAYQPRKAPANSKKMTMWGQQVRGLIRRGATEPDPRKQFFTDLTKELNRLKTEGHV